MTYEWNKRWTLPYKEVKVGAEFMLGWTEMLRKYSFDMRLHESWLESMLEVVGFYNAQDLNLEKFSIEIILFEKSGVCLTVWEEKIWV